MKKIPFILTLTLAVSCGSESGVKKETEAITKAESAIKAGLKSPSSYKSISWGHIIPYSVPYMESSVYARFNDTIDSLNAEEKKLFDVYLADIMNKHKRAAYDSARGLATDAIIRKQNYLDEYYKHPEIKGVCITNTYDAQNSYGADLRGSATVVFDNDSALNVIDVIFND